MPSAELGAPPLCIVTVVRNGAATLPDTLASVRALAVRPLTHVLVDGRSTDGTPALLAAHRHACESLGIATVIDSQDPAGVYAAMNHGVRLSPEGALIHFLNADDRALPGAEWQRAVDAFRDPELWFAYSAIQVVTPDGRVSVLPVRPVRSPGWLRHQALITRKSLLSAHPFEGGYGLAADSIWSSKHLAGRRGAYLEEPLAEVKLIGLSYRHPWKVTASYARYLLEEGHYLQAGLEWGRTTVGVAGRIVSKVRRMGNRMGASR